MSGPTPGPWNYHQTTKQGRASKNANSVIFYYPTLFSSWRLAVAEVLPTPYDHGEANARLIAAAPQLLEAAIEAEKLLLPLAESTEEHDRYQVMVLVLRQAIAKATE